MSSEAETKDNSSITKSTGNEEEASTSTTAAATAKTTTNSDTLTEPQTRALFDILTHHETYAEITGFKSSRAVTSYGFPFKNTTILPTTPLSTAPNTPRVRTPVLSFSSKDSAKSSIQHHHNASDEQNDSGGADAHGDDASSIRQLTSTSPILQLLLTRIVLPLPGVNQLPREFWSIRIQSLLARLGDADLSESYDKGAMGTRKTLATGSSAVVEMLGRGVLGGLDKRVTGTATSNVKDESQDGGPADAKYDHGNADDLERAWGDVQQGLVYGDLVDQLFDHFSEEDNLETISSTVEASAKHNIFHIATLAHQIFILSPEGQYLLKLLENVHSLIPYKMLKQTLRIGNAATMINGMVRLMLAKLSVTSVTNWFGLTANADDGMNLLQRIISLVLSWDASEFKKSAERIEKAKDRPTDQMLRAIREYIDESRSEHDTVRTASEDNSQSIITSIFNASNPSLNKAMTETEHAQCLEYYSALLSVRDRDAITTAICRQPPDMFTQSVKDVVAAYEPIIRTVHSNVDLKEHFDALQGFIEEFIRASKPKKDSSSGSAGEGKMVSVEDYVDLLMRNRHLLYKWIHALASSCPDIWESLRTWSKNMIVKFRKRDSETSMEQTLNNLYSSLDESARTQVLSSIDAHAAYLDTLNAISHARLQYLVTAADSAGGTTVGPGVYLARWQELLDSTPITPAEPRGKPRHGNDVKHTTTMGKTGVGGKKLKGDGEGGMNGVNDGVEAPDVGVVVRELGDVFRRAICEMASSI